MTQPYTSAEIVARAIKARTTPGYWDAHHDADTLAEIATSALAAAGRLTPAGGETRTEWEPVTYGGLVVHPGDTLIVWTERPLTAEHADMYRTKLRERLPDLAEVVVLNAAGVAAYRPHEEDTDRG